MKTIEEIIKEFENKYKDDTTIGGYYSELESFLRQALQAQYKQGMADEREKLSKMFSEITGTLTNN